MFQVLGNTVSRAWALLLLGWVALLVCSWALAPSWDKIGKDGEFAFLPADAPSRRGEQLFREAFPNSFYGSSVVLVVSRENNESGLLDQDRKFITDVLTPELGEIAASSEQESIVTQILTFEEPGLGALLVSPDKKATLIVVELTTEFLNRLNEPTLSKIEDLVDRLRRDGKVPTGLAVAVTGSATAGRDTRAAERDSVHAIERWTVVVVVVLLLLLYRAPLLALIPLATVYFAVQISLNVLALMAAAGLIEFFREVRIYITVLVYGAGVDYCLFLISRYHEELDAGLSFKEGVANAIGRVGATITASAATVIGGIAMMAFANFGKIHQAGIAIPISLVIVLLGALTFSPSLLRLTRQWASWPHMPTSGGKRVAASGGVVPPPLQGLRTQLPAQSFLGRLLRGGLLPNVWERVGEVLLRGPGKIWLITVAAMTPFAIMAGLNYYGLNYDPVSELPEGVPSAVGTRVLEQHFSQGVMGPVAVLVKNDHIDFSSDQGVGLIAALTDFLKERQSDLQLADVRSLAEPLGITAAAKKFVSGLAVPAETIQQGVRREARSTYVSRTGDFKGHVTRLELLLNANPFSRRAISDLDRIKGVLRASLPQELRDGSQVEFSGATAGLQDLQAVTEGDLERIEILVPIVVLGILLILLRRLLISIYLVLSVLFSFLATFGVTFVVFWLLQRDAFLGLDWKVPILLFTILVAVGEDYNIFLMTRIHEEQARHGSERGITLALARTGRIISSCGFIMAGTFASLLSGTLLSMRELGFALAFGVLLDTLVVRSILVPTFLILLQRRGFGRAKELLPGQ
jgi:RND superfamily putative drug exporter